MKESRKRYCLRGGLVGSTKEASAMSTYESYRRRDRDAKRLSAPLEVEKRIQHECPSAAGAPLWPHSCEIRCRTRTPPSPEPSNADATAQEHHHLGVRSKSRSIRRSAKGTPGFSGACRSPQGAQLPLVFPWLLKGLALASASALLSPCAAKRVQTPLSIPPTTPCLPPVNVAQDRIVGSICELRPVAAWGFVMVNAQFGDRR